MKQLRALLCLFLTLSADAAVGAVAKLGVKQGNTTRLLILTKKTADTVEIQYKEK